MTKSKIIIILLLIVLAFFCYQIYIITMHDDIVEDITVSIPDGSNIISISQILKDKKVIPSRFVFIVDVLKSGKQNSLQSGDFDLTTTMNRDLLIKTLTNELENVEKKEEVNNIDAKNIKLIIPEGYELRQIADRIEDNGFNKEEFLSLAENKNKFEKDYEFLKEIPDGQSLEGFLYPATYDILSTNNEEEIIRKMLDAFNQIYVSEIKDNVNNSKLNFNEIITLASIIEREAKLDEERALISSVFYNRLNQGMKLQSCATVQYVLEERKERLLNKDLEIDSPFNTYQHNGLPPAPIASPGKASLLAAINPADTDYLFFHLTGEDGSHTFTTNYEDHESVRPK